MENRLLTRERMDRMIEARDRAEALKVLTECGYPEGESLEAVLAQARADTFRDLESASPDKRLVELFQLKYDYHNAKAILKARAVGADPERLLLPGGRYGGRELLESWQREDLRGCSETFRKAMTQAKAVLTESRDPQRADLVLDRACFEEMAQRAKDLDSRFLQGYVALTVDVANLRASIRIHRMGREGDFLRQVLLPGGTVSEQAIAAARGENLGEVFRACPSGSGRRTGRQADPAGERGADRL